MLVIVVLLGLATAWAGCFRQTPCIDPGRPVCCGNDCINPSTDSCCGDFSCFGGQCCAGTCFMPPQTCCAGIVCPAGRCCGTACCAFGTFCCGTNTCCPNGSKCKAGGCWFQDTHKDKDMSCIYSCPILTPPYGTATCNWECPGDTSCAGYCSESYPWCNTGCS